MSTKSRILDEALNQFNEKGLHQVGVREIARSLEISPGNLSYHFPKKEDLVLEILKVYSAKNQEFRQAYLEGAASLNRFVEMFESMFHNQFEHRGLLIELIEVNRLLKAETSFDYTETQEARIRDFEKMVENLQVEKEIVSGEQNSKSVVSFLTLFGRFWIAEAFLTNATLSKGAAVNHYIDLLAKQLSLFATEKGKYSLSS